MEENKQVVTQKHELKNEKVNFESTFWSISTVCILM